MSAEDIWLAPIPVGRLNWTDFAGLAVGCVLRDLTVSITFRQRATVVDMDWTAAVSAVVGGCEEELGADAASTCSMKGRADGVEGGAYGG